MYSTVSQFSTEIQCILYFGKEFGYGLYIRLIFFSERHFGSIVGASGTLIVLGGRDGSATPMALGGMEQWREGAWHQGIHLYYEKKVKGKVFKS